jgi:chorismate dehydratase
MKYTVGSVPYVNAAPLISYFDFLGDRSPVKVRTAVPALLPDLLDEGAQAIMVSSVDALRHPDRRLVKGFGVGSNGPVESVRLFSKEPMEEIRTLALDQSSMTSNRLAQVLLHDLYAVRPQTESRPPDLRQMLEEHDACVLIGDKGFEADGRDLYVLDLGEAWTQLTELPFLWAGWIGGDSVTEELAGYLDEARLWSKCGRAEARRNPEPSEGRDHTIRFAMRNSGWSEERARHYLLETMVYDDTEQSPLFEGLREFQRRLLANGFDDCGHLPTLV